MPNGRGDQWSPMSLRLIRGVEGYEGGSCVIGS